MQELEGHLQHPEKLEDPEEVLRGLSSFLAGLSEWPVLGFCWQDFCADLAGSDLCFRVCITECHGLLPSVMWGRRQSVFP